MEYVEISIGNFKNFLEHIRLKLLYSVPKTADNDELYKPIKLTLQLVKVIKEMTPSAQNMLNDVYGIIKKYFQIIKEFTTSTISRDNNFSDLKKSSLRAVIYIKEIYGSVLDNASKQTNNDYGFLNIEKENDNFNNHLKFNLDMKAYSNMPYCEEYIMYNLVVHENNIFFHRVNDTIYRFFYFYKSEDNIWYWSPPKKTDPEDVWMECPKYIVEEGYWKGTQIPKFAEAFVIWLDLLNPDLPFIERVSEED